MESLTRGKAYKAHVFHTSARWDAIDDDTRHVLVIVGDNEVCRSRGR
jgi:hypothetical protein